MRTQHLPSVSKPTQNDFVRGQESRPRTIILFADLLTTVFMRTLDLTSVSKCTDYDLVRRQESRPRTSALFADLRTIYENTRLTVCRY